jgi:hypothetical protein
MNATRGKFKDKRTKVTIKCCFHLLLEVVSIFEVLEDEVVVFSSTACIPYAFSVTLWFASPSPRVSLFA